MNEQSFDSSECADLQWQVHNIGRGSDYQKMFDSAKFVIEHCAEFDTLLYLPVSIDFGVASKGCQYMSGDLKRYSSYRDWLKKVLYLTRDSGYYCSDVMAILSTFQYFNDQRGNDINGELAILKFLIDSNRCITYLAGKPDWLWKQARQEQYDIWLDTAKHSKPLVDTTLPSLEDLDLEILKGLQFAAVRNTLNPSSNNKILFFAPVSTPFGKELSLNFDLADAEYMKVELYDILGNLIYSESQLFNSGYHFWHVRASQLPYGIIYARLSSFKGETKSVKLLHEK
jgi:hypothetical protein